MTASRSEKGAVWPGLACDPTTAGQAVAAYLQTHRFERPPAPLQDALMAIFDGSPYLRALCERHPDDLAAILKTPPQHYPATLMAGLENQMAAAESQSTAMRILRIFKRRLALSLGLYDLAGLLTVEEVMQALTDAAELCVAQAVDFLFREAAAAGKIIADDGTAASSAGYFVLAMGKLGAGELNYSSDIDLVIFYDPQRVRLAPGIEAQPFFVKLTQTLVRMLQERTKHGYVFRTDLRLRPDPGSTQVALSTEAALIYYESVGQNWERAAMIKARPIAGDLEAGQTFLAELSPFIWRKYLDYAMIRDIHAMKRRVHEVKGHGTITVPGHNVKLGRGGIREIEFFVQTQQLIAGGRNKALQGRKTVDMLFALWQAGWISQQAAGELAEAYRFLRHIEHRLQMVQDAQTHSLPQDHERLAAFACFAGFADLPALEAELLRQMRIVERHYAALFEEMPSPAEERAGAVLPAGITTQTLTGPESREALERMGFHDAKSVAALIKGWQNGAFPAMRSERAREDLHDLLPHLLLALSQTVHPDFAVAAFDQFLRHLPAGVQLFALLRANPELLRLLANIMGQAPRLARELARRPNLLDAVLDPAFFGEMPQVDEIEAMLAERLSGARNFEDLLDLARIAGREQGFLIGVRLLSGVLHAEQAAPAYTMIAETIICHMKRAVEAEFVKTHGHVPGGGFAVIGMGKLGGREMSAASDIDLIIIYDHAEGVPLSDGAKPLAADVYYKRLTQRLITALSAPTAQGRLYEVDMRLRPSGRSGPLATKIASFIPYQHHEAWTWEHLALTRARVLCGPKPLRQQIEATIAAVLSKPREAARIAADVRDMRERVYKEKGSSNPWDIKQVRGGLIDLEFLVQYLQIVHAHDHPEILDSNIRQALEHLAAAGILPRDDAARLKQIAALYHDLTQILALCIEGPLQPDQAPAGLKKLLAMTADQPDFDHLQAELVRSQSDLTVLFDKYIAQIVAS